MYLLPLRGPYDRHKIEKMKHKIVKIGFYLILILVVDLMSLEQIR